MAASAAILGSRREGTRCFISNSGPPHFVLRGDLRVDWSDRDVFLDQEEPDGRQSTILLGAPFAF